MYQVKVWGPDGVQYTLHDPRDPATFLIDPTLSLTVNKSGTLTFEIEPGHPHAGKIQKMASEIGVYQDGVPLYVGRPLNSVDDLYSLSTVTCEGVLAYLLDSIVRPFEYTGGIQGLFQQFLEGHNSQVEERKRFKLGNVTVTDSNDYINRSNSGYSTTLDAINDKLLKTHGGYLRVRFEEDGRYLDYLSDYGHTCSQVIRFGENLLDLNRHIDPDELMTAIIPLGAETDEDGINGVKKRVNIKSVNGGLDYLVDETAAEKFGFICRVVEFDDVTLPQNLKSKGRAYLDERKNLIHSLELSAVDLHMTDVDVESISLGDQIRVVSPPHDLDSLFMVSQLSLHLTDPGNNTLSLGKALETMTAATGKIQDGVSGELQSVADGISARLVVADQSIAAEVERASNAESDLDVDISSLRVDVKGITFSVSNGGTSSFFRMRVGDTVITSPIIEFSGMVKFSDLYTSGETVINGDNITTGTINAARIDITGDGLKAIGGFCSATGYDGTSTTTGAKMYGSNPDYYFIATNAGVRMQSPGESLYCSANLIRASTPIDDSSDRSLKNSIAYDLERYEALFLALKPACFKFNGGTSDRFHTGFIAQDVEEAILGAGLTTKDFAALVIEEHENPEKRGEQVTEYGLRYSEFVSLNTYMIQQLFQRMDSLEKRIEELEGRPYGDNC